MQTTQSIGSTSGWGAETGTPLGRAANLVFVFGSRHALEGDALAQLRARHPSAILFGCSTAGDIAGVRVLDDTIVATAVRFEATAVRAASTRIEAGEDSFRAGARLARELPHQDLVHVLVLSDGTRVNGSELARGLSETLPEGVIATGGLSADGARFETTRVLLDGPAEAGLIAAVGFYGPQIHVGCGSLGGWDAFGPERLITRSKSNVLYELDGVPALRLYRQYLGSEAEKLPASALLFPLSVRPATGGAGVVRTVLGVSDAEGSMTFAGDVPEGSLARLMKANFERLIDGAMGAARNSYDALGTQAPDLALLISCVGRKLVLGQRIEEEVEAVREVLGEKAALCGFYSYGEISPNTPSARCELHNQTMTVTTFRED